MSTVRVEWEKTRPDGRVQGGTTNLNTDSPVGSLFVGQGRAVRVEITTHFGEVVTYAFFDHFVSQTRTG